MSGFTDTTADAAIAKAALRRFGGAAERSRFAPGQALADQGAPVTALYLLEQGRALASRAVDGDAVPVEDLGPGALIGLDGVCGTGCHGLSVVAQTDAIARVVPVEVFLEQVTSDPEAGLLAFALLSSRLRACISAVDDLKFLDLTARLARYLLARLPAEREQGPALLRLTLPKKTIALHLGMTQSSLSRLLRQMRNHGVTVSGRDVAIADIAALRDLAAPEPEA